MSIQVAEGRLQILTDYGTLNTKKNEPTFTRNQSVFIATRQ